MSNETSNERLLRDVAASTTIRFGTTAPFQLGEVQFEKVGFAESPVAQVMVYCYQRCISALVPIVRQHVFHELETAGMSSDILEFVPRVQINKRRRFVDCNESSPIKGKNKVGNCCRFTFDIKPDHVKDFVWDGFCHKIGHIPERRPTSAPH